MPITAIKRPNFFILGAGKAGTTSLYHHLKQHPDIFMPAVKEPTFFCEGYQVIKDPIEYFALFDAADTETAIGEASHAYLTNPSTARVLHGLFPDARFVVILRDPADRAYSLYNHMRRHGYERISPFEMALQAEERRCCSPHFRRECPQYFYNFLYFRSGLYGEQLSRYYSLFDKAQFHILTLEQLSADPAHALRAIFAFLGVNPDFLPQIRVYNEGTVTARFPRVQTFWVNAIHGPRRIKELGLGVLARVNMKTILPMRAETRKDLMGRYAADLEVLHDLTGVRFPA